jgi:hypothetical protein
MGTREENSGKVLVDAPKSGEERRVTMKTVRPPADRVPGNSYPIEETSVNKLRALNPWGL